MALKPEIIGDATLYLGDCLEILPILGDESVDMVWTDPPYGHSNHEGDFNARLNEFREIKGAPIINDDADSMRVVLDGMLTAAARVLRQDCCCCCCCGGGGPRPTFAWVADRMDKGGLSFFHSVIWDKRNPGLGWRYRRQHEMIMVAHREGGKLRWQNNDITARNIFSLMPPRERVHPNEKPLGLVRHFIGLHTGPNDVVLDPFMGSGTTGVACAKLGRKFIGIEIEPKYFDIACQRIQKAYDQPDLFVEPPKKAEQHDLALKPNAG